MWGALGISGNYQKTKGRYFASTPVFYDWHFPILRKAVDHCRFHFRPYATLSALNADSNPSKRHFRRVSA
jgi:hypothetical protein